jgi:hypothetical protein
MLEKKLMRIFVLKPEEVTGELGGGDYIRSSFVHVLLQ